MNAFRLVRVQILLSFLLMCSRERPPVAPRPTHMSPEREGHRGGVTDSPALDMGYDEDPDQIRATTMLDDLG